MIANIELKHLQETCKRERYQHRSTQRKTDSFYNLVSTMKDIFRAINISTVHLQNFNLLYKLEEEEISKN